MLGIIEIVAVIIGVAALVYLVYALLKADRF
ncbi:MULTISPECIES: K(+)-transporting ATPase subunit F [Leucobacter]|nr:MULTISPECIES: K(+)-transporting ATPase subunit F [unclassified Leucobacter]PIJ46677.1 potassium-transporting ATPase subunit F [Leucobacter sp. OLES1]